MNALRSAVAAAIVFLAASPPPALAAPTSAQLDSLPPPASRTVDFTADIQPILEASCVKCHGRGKANGGFQLDTRETFLKDADSGPAIIPGRSRDSRLIHLVAALDPDDVMPVKGSKLTSDQVSVLRAWIDQGLKWDEGVTFAREPHRHLSPRRPALPDDSAGLSHPVDRLVGAYFKEHHVTFPAVVDDRTFARRVFLDAIGLLPSPGELDAFLADRRPDKRERLVERLLSDSPRYSQHWLTFWNDLLRNDYRGTGYIDGGREQITRWLYASLRDNLPYDRFVRELVDPDDDGPRGFAKGIVWRGVVNSSQTPQMQAAQNISQVFLGVNLKCASCHDSFIDDWQLADAYGMAGVYADEKLELVRCDKPLGRHAPVKFVFPELGSIDDDAPKSERIARLAELLTSPANGRLSRTVVNRLWAQFFGHGLVEPLDVMQNPAWHPDLLDWLAEDLVAHGYDLKRTMSLILTSRAYQLPVVNLAEGPVQGYAFKGPAVRRLTAEQFRDALGQVSGVWHDRPEGNLDALLLERGPSSEPPAAAYWIWTDPHAADAAPPQTVFFRKTVDLPETPSEAVALVHADNSHRLWINGREARRKNDIPWSETSVLDIRSFLRRGSNSFAVEAVNGGDGPNPAGLLFYARLRLGDSASASAPTNGDKTRPQAILDFGSDASWLSSTTSAEGWQKAEFNSTGWSAAQVLAPPGGGPWNVGAQFAAAVAGRTVYGSVRAALVPSDPLTRALGRPNREQVTTQRPSLATTLQMLELTNGQTLARVLKEGAQSLTALHGSGDRLVREVFQRALGREPTAEEQSTSLAFVGPQPGAAQVEDLLWSVAMLPEFQLIH